MLKPNVLSVIINLISIFIHIFSQIIKTHTYHCSNKNERLVGSMLINNFIIIKDTCFYGTTNLKNGTHTKFLRKV